MNANGLINNEPQKFNLLIENVQDFYIKKDFMFAVRKVIFSSEFICFFLDEKFFMYFFRQNR